MKTGEEKNSKVSQSPRVPRVVLTSNSQCGRQGLPNPDARKSTDHQGEQSVYRETCRGNVDYRIPSIPHSTVQKEDTNRKETVKRLIQQFENHPCHDSLIEDLNKTEEFNPFSEKSKELITSMGNTEHFELCEMSSKIQCPDCALYWEAGIIHCICGKFLQPAERNRQLNNERFTSCQFLATSSKNPTHSARHGPSVRQTMYLKAHDVLRKARSNKNGNCSTILDRWYRDDKYRKSLSDMGWTKEQIEQYNALAMEDHSYAATPEDRSRYKKSWKISLNKEGTQGPTKQHPDFREPTQKCKRLYDEDVERTGEGNRPIPPAQQIRQRREQQFE